jgi:hypothetical protein
MPRKHQKYRILYLETQLDKNIDSKRTQVSFMKELIANLTPEDFEVITKEVHSREDLNKFLSYARRDPKILYIHFGGHGLAKRGLCSIVLTKNEKINLKHKRNLELFKNLPNKTISFSCCQIGSNTETINNILKISKADAIFGYSRDVLDSQAIIIESLFYHYCCASEVRYTFETIYEKIKFAADVLNIDTAKEPLADPLFVGYFG